MSKNNSYIFETLKILRCAYNNEPYLPCALIDFKTIYKIAKTHGVVNLVYSAVSTIENIDTEVLNLFKKEVAKNNAVLATQEHYLTQIINEFNQNNIEFILLKGSQIKQLYKHPHWREMNDIDILYRNNKNVKTVMENIGITLKTETDYDDHYVLPPHLIVELHKKPSEIEEFNNYYNNIFEKANLVTNYQKALSNEDLLIYTILHAYRHFIKGGIGIKPIIDIYVIKSQNNFNEDYVKGEMQKLNLLTFYNKFVYLANVWFNNAKSNEFYDTLTEFLFGSGAFGSKKHNVAEGINKQGSKPKYLLNRAFPPANELLISYPILKKSTLFLPFVWAIRLIKAPFKKSARKELKYAKAIKKQDNKLYNKLLTELDIKR